MRCALVFHVVATTIFVIVSSAPELCMFRDLFLETRAICGRNDVGNTFDFIPPISQNITLIDLTSQPLKQLPYNALRNVSSQSSVFQIWLQNCQISHVDAGALLNLHNLLAIDLSFNNITQIDSKLFSDTKQIRYINMAYNNIEVVPSGLFQNLTRLEEVFLTRNRIRQVEWFSFKNTPSLYVIALHYNQIDFMDMLFKDTFDNLTYLWLDNNPWKCDCELGPLYEYLLETNQLNDEELVCEKPPTLHGRQWRYMRRDEFICSAEDATTTQDSLITTTEQGDNVPVTAYNGTRYQPVDTGVPQPQSNQNWIPRTILVLVLVCVTAVIIGVVLFKRRSARRTAARNMDSDLSMRIVQSRAVSENGDSASNTADVDDPPL